MKILILSNLDIGLYQFRRELIYQLLENNEVYISLPYGELVEKLVDAGCHFINTPMDRRGINPFTDMSLLISYFHVLHSIRPDMVITYTIKPNIYGGCACRIMGIPYAANITGLGTAFEKNGLLRKLVIMLYKWALVRAKVVFFENSENMSVFLLDNICNEDQACLLSGAGVNLEHFSYKHYPNNEIFRFLFIGRIMQEKGIDELLQVMNNLDNCVLDVVGPFEDKYEVLLKKYEKNKRLVYHGYQKDVRPFIELSDCFVLPSWHEGMANTNLECAASGRPIITSNIPGCREAVIDGVTGILCMPKDTVSLSNAMKSMLALSRSERECMGKLGRKHMEEEFDKNKVIDMTIKCLFD